MLTITDGMLGDGAKIRERLTRMDIKRVTEFEQWCNVHGLQMDLLCRHCFENDARESRCVGDNDPESTSYKISCGCRDRVYGNPGVGKA